jgi:hypothetical protein
LVAEAKVAARKIFAAIQQLSTGQTPILQSVGSLRCCKVD